MKNRWIYVRMWTHFYKTSFKPLHLQQQQHPPLLNPSILFNSKAVKPFLFLFYFFILRYKNAKLFLTFKFLSFFSFFWWVLGRPNQASDVQFCYINLFDMPFRQSDFFLAYIQNKLAEGGHFAGNFGRPKMLSRKQ